MVAFRFGHITLKIYKKVSRLMKFGQNCPEGNEYMRLQEINTPFHQHRHKAIPDPESAPYLPLRGEEIALIQEPWSVVSKVCGNPRICNMDNTPIFMR